MSSVRKLKPWRDFTPRQLEIRDAIVELRRRNSRDPSLSQIARHTGMAAHSYVARVVIKLKTRGEYP